MTIHLVIPNRDTRIKILVSSLTQFVTVVTREGAVTCHNSIRHVLLSMPEFKTTSNSDVKVALRVDGLNCMHQLAPNSGFRGFYSHRRSTTKRLIAWLLCAWTDVSLSCC